MNHDHDLERALQETLNREDDHLDLATLARLRQARHRALSARPDRSRSRWYGVAGAASTLLVLLLLLAGPFGKDQKQPAVAAGSPALFEVMTSEEPLELYLEDIAFYAWLAEELLVEEAREPHGGIDHHGTPTGKESGEWTAGVPAQRRAARLSRAISGGWRLDRPRTAVGRTTGTLLYPATGGGTS